MNSRSLSAGRYKLTVTAEDFAHKHRSGEVEIEFFPNRRVIVAVCFGALVALACGTQQMDGGSTRANRLEAVFSFAP